MFPATFNLLGGRQPRCITISPPVSTPAEAWKHTSGFVFHQTRGFGFELAGHCITGKPSLFSKYNLASVSLYLNLSCADSV